MGFKQIGIMETLILCCALVLPGAAATIDISQKRLHAGKKITVMIDGTADPVPNSAFFMSGAGSGAVYSVYNR